MLTIGEFSKICEVSTKTLRYYDEIGLIKPSEINPENGYRYYSIKQLETMLLINRLKLYHFSLEQIRELIVVEEKRNDILCYKLCKKKQEIKNQLQAYTTMIEQLNQDISALKQGNSLLSYLDPIDIQLVENPAIHLLSIRKLVLKCEFFQQYQDSFHFLLKKVMLDQLTINAPARVLFHSDEFNPFGLDTEFAIPVEQCTSQTRDFLPGLCLKTTLYGSYTNLPSIYAMQCEWAQQNGYKNNGPLYEVYCVDPMETAREEDLVTEIYYPVKKK